MHPTSRRGKESPFISSDQHTLHAHQMVKTDFNNPKIYTYPACDPLFQNASLVEILTLHERDYF
jgi:hypothetical protein